MSLVCYVLLYVVALCVKMRYVILCIKQLFIIRNAFSALTLLAGHQEEHPACKNGVMRCWCGYQSGVRCKLFACGPADATASPSFLLPHLNPDWFYLSGTPGKDAIKWT